MICFRKLEKVTLNIAINLHGGVVAVTHILRKVKSFVEKKNGMHIFFLN